MKPPSILHVATQDMAVRFIIGRQMLYLQRKGFRVKGLTAPGPYAESIRKMDLDCDYLPMAHAVNPWRDLSALRAVTRYIKENDFTIVHTHTSKAGILGRWAARWAKSPITIHTIHGFYFHEHMPWMKREFFALQEKLAARWACDLLLSQNREDIQTAERRGINAGRPIVHIGNGVDLTRFNAEKVRQETNRAELRRQIGLDADAFVAGIVLRINHEKGMKELIQAVAACEERGAPVELLVVGEGPAQADFEALAERLSITKRIHFHGFSTQIPELLWAMDLYVLPSYREGLPRSIIEAMAMGLPVVATRIRGCRELVSDGRNGLLVPPFESAPLAEALETLRNNERLRTAMAEAARRKALREFDEERVFERIEQAYCVLLEEHRPRVFTGRWPLEEEASRESGGDSE